MKKKKTVVLIDGKWVAYRAHFSKMGLATSNGTPTGLIHGFLWELLQINRKLPKASLVVCWDGEGKTWRHSLLPTYKAQRPFNPEFEKMVLQIKLLLPVIRSLGLKLMRMRCVEADDMIGMASRALNSCEVRVYSSDRDMYQLVCPWVTVWPGHKEKLIRQREVEEWSGIPIHGLLDIRAMAGDPGDNLKGLPGIGMVKAKDLWKAGYRVKYPSEDVKKSKYWEHWPRLQDEMKAAEIVVRTDSEKWSEEQSSELKEMMDSLREEPGQDREVAEENRTWFYKFLGRYELEELMQERHKFLRLP